MAKKKREKKTWNEKNIKISLSNELSEFYVPLCVCVNVIFCSCQNWFSESNMRNLAFGSTVDWTWAIRFVNVERVSLTLMLSQYTQSNCFSSASYANNAHRARARASERNEKRTGSNDFFFRHRVLPSFTIQLWCVRVLPASKPLSVFLHSSCFLNIHRLRLWARAMVQGYIRCCCCYCRWFYFWNKKKSEFRYCQAFDRRCKMIEKSTKHEKKQIVSFQQPFELSNGRDRLDLSTLTIFHCISCNIGDFRIFRTSIVLLHYARHL